MTDSVLSVRNLKVSVKSASVWLSIVRGIDFDLYPGEITGLAGESGCGKTITAMALMNLLPPDQVRIEADRLVVDVNHLNQMTHNAINALRGKTLAMVFQDPGASLDPVFKVGFQIAATLRRKLGLSRKQSKASAITALAEVGFDQPERIFHRYPHELSGGMKQLAMIAMATAIKPTVLIADEPTTALDVTTQSIILHHLKMLSREHKTAVLMITHDLRVLAQIAEKLMVMYQGKVVESGDCRSLLDQPCHPYTAGLIAAVPQLTDESGPGVKPIPGTAPNWEDLPEGCAFAPRCIRADETCNQQPPELQKLASGRTACHHPL